MSFTERGAADEWLKRTRVVGNIWQGLNAQGKIGQALNEARMNSPLHQAALAIEPDSETAEYIRKLFKDNEPPAPSAGDEQS